MRKDEVDKRFSGIGKDPRFRRPAAKKSKTVLDSRFKHILTDERFRGSSGMNPRGFSEKKNTRKSKKNVNEDIQKFYQVEDDNEQPNAESSDEVSDKDGGFHWDAQSSSDDEDKQINLDENEMSTPTNIPEDDFAAHQEEEEDIELGESTDTIALMNCNWENITATDLYVLIQNFLDDHAPGRRCVRISVHKSDYGAERLEMEEQFGPQIEGLPVEDENLKTKEELDAIDQQRDAAIRKYEQQRKLYYFAIAKFDSINTACIVYDELDGVAAGVCAESFDLRFVPEGTPDPSEKRDPTSECDVIPEGYSPPNIEVSNVMMQHSKVKLSWDEDPPERKILLKKLTPSQIANLDLDAYLESEDDDEVDADALRKALFGGAAPHGDVSKDSETDNSEVAESGDEAVEASEKNDSDFSDDNKTEMGDMEMRFSRDVESVGKNVAKRLAAAAADASSSDKTVWEKYLDKRKDAKKAKRAERRAKIEKQRQERSDAAKAAITAAKNARENETDSSDEDDANFTASRGNLEDMAQDDRLAKLFKDPRFAVDPTHPSYKKNSVVNTIKRKHK